MATIGLVTPRGMEAKPNKGLDGHNPPHLLRRRHDLWPACRVSVRGVSEIAGVDAVESGLTRRAEVSGNGFSDDAVEAAIAEAGYDDRDSSPPTSMRHYVEMLVAMLLRRDEYSGAHVHRALQAEVAA